MPSNTIKQICVLFLALALTISLMPVNTYATESDEQLPSGNPTIVQFQTEIDRILISYLGSTILSREEIQAKIDPMEWDVYQYARYEISLLNESIFVAMDSGTVTQAELQILGEANSVFGVFSNALNDKYEKENFVQMYADVSLFDGALLITDSKGNGNGSGTSYTATSPATFWTGSSNTVTFTNTTDVPKHIQFAYEIKNADGYGTLFTASSGTIDTQISAKGTLQGVFNAGWFSNATLTLKDITFTDISATENVTFKYNSNLGKIQDADGNDVANDAEKEIDTTAGATFTAVPNSGVSFLGWTDGSGKLLSQDATYMVKPNTEMTVKAVFSSASSSACFAVGVISSNKVPTYAYLFDDLNAANACAAGSTAKGIVLAGNGTLLSGSYTISSGVTLLIPFDSANTIYTSDPGKTNSGYATPNPYRTLTMTSGASLSISGVMSVSAVNYAASGSKKNAGSPTGAVGFVKMGDNSSITVTNGGALYAYGFIMGSGSVTAKSGSSVHEHFQVMDFRGGSQSKDMQNEVFPLSQYYIQNIEVPLTLEYGASETVHAAVTVSSSGFSTAFTFVGNDSETAMFKMQPGTTVKKYYDGSTDRLHVEVDGKIAISSVSLRFGGTILGMTINSAEYVLPINGNMTLTLKPNSVITAGQDICLYPGVQVYIDEGASLTMGSGNSLYVYDSENWGAFCGPGNATHIPLDYAPGRVNGVKWSLADVAICVNGTLSSGSGYIYATTGGANIYSTATGTAALTAGTESSTYQLVQGTGYTTIPITPAKLKNSDGKYTETKESNGTYTYASGFWHKPGCDGTTTESVTTKPTCTTEGVKTIQCSCGIIKSTASIQETGHNYTSKVTTNPTCTQEGVKTFTCQNDSSHTYTEAISALGHSYKAVVTDPTCTAEGYTTYTCANCGDVYVSDYVPSLGHTTITDEAVAPKCNATGLTEGSHCSVCEEVFVAQTEIAKDPNNHAGEEFTYEANVDGKKHTKKYKCCGEAVLTEDHTYNNGKCIACEAPQKFTVTWKNGETIVETEEVEYGENATLTPAVPERTGYTGSWNGNTTSIKADTVITATYTANKYNVTWKSNGTIYNGPEEQSYDAKLTPPTNEPTNKTGYTFNGWWTAETGGDKVTEDTVFQNTEDTTYYAQWKANTYTIIWNVDGDTSRTTQQTYDTPLALHKAPTKDGHTFLGWFTSETGGEQVTEATVYTTAGETTYHAQWKVNEYTVTWYVNEEIVETDTVTYKTVPSYDGASPIKAKDNCIEYTFAGWSVTRNGPALKEEDLPAVEQNIEYFAVFTATTTHHKSTEWSHNETHHWHGCANCNAYIRYDYANHEFDEDGKCVCGFQQLTDLFRIYATNIKAGDSLDMNFYVQKKDVAKLSNCVAIITKTYADGRYFKPITIPQGEWTPYGSDLLRFGFSDISAKEMTDEVYVIIKDSEGNQISATYYESVESYALRALALYTDAPSGSKNEKLRTALVDMLYYGAAAQTYFGYGLDDMASKGITDEYAEYATKGTPGVEDIATNLNKFTNFECDNLVAESNITYNFYFSGITKETKAYISYTTHGGTIYERKEVDGSKFVSTNYGNIPVLGVPVEGLAIADGRQVITCVVEDANGKTVANAQGSIESYVERNMDNGNSPLVVPLMRFVDSAYAYFHHGKQTN